MASHRPQPVGRVREDYQGECYRSIGVRMEQCPGPANSLVEFSVWRIGDPYFVNGPCESHQSGDDIMLTGRTSTFGA